MNTRPAVRMIAVAAACALALGSALAGTAPASAATGGIVVTSPRNGATGVVSPRTYPTVTASGTGLPANDYLAGTYDTGPNTAVNKVGVFGDGLPVPSTPGAWNDDLQFAGLAPGQTHVRVTMFAYANSSTPSSPDPGVARATFEFDFGSAPLPKVNAGPVTIATDARVYTSDSAKSPGVSPTASGFDPNEGVLEVFLSPDGTVGLYNGETSADASGDVKDAQFAAADPTAGTWTVAFYGAKKGHAAYATYEVLAPGVALPAPTRVTPAPAPTPTPTPTAEATPSATPAISASAAGPVQGLGALAWVVAIGVVALAALATLVIMSLRRRALRSTTPGTPSRTDSTV